MNKNKKIKFHSYNKADPDEMPSFPASHLGLRYL